MNPLLLGIAGNAVGSFLLGREQREARLEDQKLKQQQMKMLMDAQKLKDAKEERLAAKEERIASIFTNLFGPELAGGQEQPQGGETSGLQFDDTFGDQSSAATTPKPKSRLLDVLSDPIKAAALKQMTGIDFLGAVNSQRQQEAEQRMWTQFLYRMQNDEINRALQAGQGTWTEQDAPEGGGKIPVFRPSNPAAASRYGGGGLGAAPPNLGARPPMGKPPALGGGGNRSKLPETMLPISQDDIPTWRHPENKKLQPGMTPEQAKQHGFVRFSATEAPKIDQLENGLDILNTIESLMVAAGIPRTGEATKLPGVVRGAKATLQLGREGQALAKLRDFIEGNKAALARLGGDVGNMSETEQEQIKDSLGRITDAGPKAWEQFDLVKRKYGRMKARKYGLMPDKVPDGVDMVYNPITKQLEPAK